ncbi:DUF4266 domain-containing protein [Chitinimonas sp. PSY-7]|uniref:DUF4266 domain-containing protein n=1 Tax=Chitinimonas sp. PSY-7 TaxID=3459088 RepID=UPI00404030B2
MKSGVVLLLAFALSACQSVMPWQKAALAQDTMKPAGPVSALSKLDLHVYTSKEAIKGGTGIGGGGCGCN